MSQAAESPTRLSVMARRVVVVVLALFIVALPQIAAHASATVSTVSLVSPHGSFAYVYDGAAHSVQAHTSDVAPGVSHEVFESRSGNVATVAGPLSAVLLNPVATNSADDVVNLASPARTQHILEGEVRPNGSFGGGHRSGTGFPGKSEFPADWSAGNIMHSISDVATDPSLVWRTGNRPGDFFVKRTRGDINIEVPIRNNQIWTGYPTNVVRNGP